MSINLAASGSSELFLFGPAPDDPSGRPPYRRIVLPGNSVVRVAGGLVHIPLGETRVVGPCDLTYEMAQDDVRGEDAA
jgi:hypothetical protein